MKKVRSSGKFHKGIYVLPNLFTSMNIFCGFYGIVSAIHGQYEKAAISILVAMIFDIMDGKVARATNTTSQFGIEYDSLADLISFGLAPGLVIYLWALEPMGRLGWLAAFLYMICGALRLARFNAMADENPSPHFSGLPIPAGAAVAATTLLLCERTHVSLVEWPVVPMIMLYVLSFLMVSTVKYNSFKKQALFRKFSFNVLVACILVFIFIAAEPPVALFLIAFTYALSGPVMTISGLRKKNTEEKFGI